MASEQLVSAFEARNSRWRIALIIAACAAFVAAGLWMVGAFGSDYPTGTRATIAGWLAIVFFGGCGAFAASRLTSTDPIMRIDSQGIWWKQWSKDTIPWSEIADIGVVQIQRQKMIGIALRDPDRYPPTTLVGKLAGANKALVGYPICLTATGSDRSFVELLAAIEAFSTPR